MPPPRDASQTFSFHVSTMPSRLSGTELRITADRQAASGAAVRQDGRRRHEPQFRDVIVQSLGVFGIVGISAGNADERGPDSFRRAANSDRSACPCQNRSATRRANDQPPARKAWGREPPWNRAARGHSSPLQHAAAAAVAAMSLEDRRHLRRRLLHLRPGSPSNRSPRLVLNPFSSNAKGGGCPPNPRQSSGRAVSQLYIVSAAPPRTTNSAKSVKSRKSRENRG